MSNSPTRTFGSGPENGGTAGESMRCFVAMPFKGFDELYSKAIRPAVEGCFGKGSCTRGDTRPTAQVIGDRIAEEIIWSDVVLAVITDNNPNVMYEIGIAHSLRKPTLLLRDRRSSAPAPFDLAQHQTIEYELSPGSDLKPYSAIQKAIKPYLTQIRDDPQYEASNLLTRLIGHRYFPYVDDFRGGKGWLLGYLDVLAMETAAQTVWEINPDGHWLAEDPLYFDRIKASVKERSRKYYYMIPDRPEDVQGMKQAFRGISSRLDDADRNQLDSILKYVTVDPEFFELMPFSVVIYNATGSPKEAILLEPMANQIGEDKFDVHAAKVRMNPQPRKSPHRWEEKTFDVRIKDRDIVVFLIKTFMKKWNDAIARECEQIASEAERQFLRETWSI